MNVLIIQPPDPEPAVADLEPTPEDCQVFAPPWSLLCLQSYLRERTRHVGHVLDTRLYSSVERELVEAISAIPEPRFAAINTATFGLGQTAGILEILSRYFPKIRTAVFGEHPSRFPEHALIARTEFAIAGDPEPILRNLLDNLDIEPRLQLIPGLIYDRQPKASASWLPSLKALSLPDWSDTFWPSYSLSSSKHALRASIRLSRGHTHQPADRAWGGQSEPLREWSFEQCARNIQQCSGLGITDVLVADPPGFWTPSRLHRWCSVLRHSRNSQPWSLLLLPLAADADIVSDLHSARCTRVQFLVPSCDPDMLEQYGCTVDGRDMAHTVTLFRQQGISVHVRFWVGGPEEHHGEYARIGKFLRAIGSHCSFSLQPFPLKLDAPLCTGDSSLPAPSIETWMEWAWDPWTRERPIPCWAEEEGASYMEYAMARVYRRALRNPNRWVQRTLRALSARNWFEEVEGKLLGLFGKPRES